MLSNLNSPFYKYNWWNKIRNENVKIKNIPTVKLYGSENYIKIILKGHCKIKVEFQDFSRDFFSFSKTFFLSKWKSIYANLETNNVLYIESRLNKRA